MNTFLWRPEDHPEEQYHSVKEMAREVCALIRHMNQKSHKENAIGKAYATYAKVGYYSLG